MNAENRRFFWLLLPACAWSFALGMLVMRLYINKLRADALVPNHRELHPLPGPSLVARLFARVVAWVRVRS